MSAVEEADTTMQYYEAALAKARAVKSGDPTTVVVEKLTAIDQLAESRVEVLAKIRSQLQELEEQMVIVKDTNPSVHQEGVGVITSGGLVEQSLEEPTTEEESVPAYRSPLDYQQDTTALETEPEEEPAPMYVGKKEKTFLDRQASGDDFYVEDPAEAAQKNKNLAKAPLASLTGALCVGLAFLVTSVTPAPEREDQFRIMPKENVDTADLLPNLPAVTLSKAVVACYACGLMDR